MAKTNPEITDVNCRRMLAYSIWLQIKNYWLYREAIRRGFEESAWTREVNMRQRDELHDKAHAMRLMAISAQLFMPGQPFHLDVYSEDRGMTWQDFLDAQDESVREQYGEALEREEVIDAMDSLDRGDEE